MRNTGRIGKWKPEAGFGFILPDDGTQQVFVHIRSFKNRSRDPVEGDKVSYSLALDDQTRLQAQSVRFAGEGRFNFPVPGRKTLAAVLILAYAAALYAARLPVWVPAVVALASAVTYLFYWRDKRAAEGRRWRVAEWELHLLSLLGGWPGALIAQSQFRHKSSKQAFRIWFYMTVVLNVAALAKTGF